MDHRHVLATVLVLSSLTGCSADRVTAPLHLSTVSHTAIALDAARAARDPHWALDFHQSFVHVPDSPSLDLTTTWTVEAWVYPRAAGNGVDQDIVSKWDGVTDASYILQIDRTGALRLVTNNGITQTIVLSNAHLQNGVWQHVAGSFDGNAETGTIRLYINGVLDTTVPNALTPIPSSQPLAFGREGNYSGGTIDGIIDEVRLWNVVRSGREIARTLNRLTGNTKGLVGYWRFEEGSGDVAADLTGNGNHGRLGEAEGTDAWDPVWTTNAAPVREARSASRLR